MQNVKAKIDYESNYHLNRHPNHFDQKYYSARAKIALRKFFNEVDLNLKLLDFGCGLGQNIYLHPNAMGYDISEFSVDFCNSKKINATTNLDGIPSNSFDYVFSSHVLEHHPNPKEMIQDMKDKLKPGGLLLLVIPHETHGKAKFELDLNQHLFTWNFQAINNLLISSGFKIQKNKYLRGAGYRKLLSIADVNFRLYCHVTNFISKVYGIKEMLVIAKKTD